MYNYPNFHDRIIRMYASYIGTVAYLNVKYLSVRTT